MLGILPFILIFVNINTGSQCITILGQTFSNLRRHPSRGHFPFQFPLENAPSLTPNPCPLTPAVFGRSGLFGPPLCGGSAPATPPPTTCLIDRVSILVTGAYSNVSSQTTSRQSHPIPAGAGLVPAFASAPTGGLRRTARPGACTAPRPKTVYNANHRWRRFPCRLFPPQIWYAHLEAISLLGTGWQTCHGMVSTKSLTRGFTRNRLHLELQNPVRSDGQRDKIPGYEPTYNYPTDFARHLTV